MLNNYQLAKAVVSHGAQKFRQVRVLKNGTRVYQVKKFTDAEYALFNEGEDYTAQEREYAIERGNWILLDSYTAGGIKALYEQIDKPELKEKVLRLSIPQLAGFVYRR